MAGADPAATRAGLSLGERVLLGGGCTSAVVTLAFITAPLPWAFGSMTAWLLLTWAAIPLAIPLVKIVRTRTDGPALNGALAKTGALQLIFCLLYSAGILAGGGIGS